MKVEVTTKEKQFEPIELKLTIESKRELEFLVSLLDATDENIVRLANSAVINCGTFKIRDVAFTYDLSNKLTRMLIELR